MNDKPDYGTEGKQEAARGSDVERPVPALPGNNALFGSDVVAETLRDLGIAYIALNPGASFRGLHDSLVNHLGNTQPQLLLCLHEEHAVGVAHGYAKVTGKAMAAAVHSNVGLMHASMAIFNAWCDRMPVIIIGATGPVDAAKRRPWIDWIHTARDQGALVRPYVKWDDQPASPQAAREALLRAAWLAETVPMGPVYVNLDTELQEDALEAPLPPATVGRFTAPARAGIRAADLRQLADMLGRAERPVIMAGRGSRSPTSWAARVALAERLGAKVLTDNKVAAAFPTLHPLQIGDLRGSTGNAARAALRESDLILALDWVDLGGALTAAFGAEPPAQPVVRVTADHTLHNGWSMDHQAHPPADLVIAADPDSVVADLLDALGGPPAEPTPLRERPAAFESSGAPLTVERLGNALRLATGERPVCLTHVTLSWDGSIWPLARPLDFLGSDGGGGIGAGPSHAVGAALALRDLGDGSLPIAICGDGDFLMGVTALWTAAHYRIPLLIVIANNRSFYNDEVHQERVAKMRGRPVENKWIGQRMTDPDIDLASMARAQGCAAFGPVGDDRDLMQIFADAIAVVESGGVACVEVIVEGGYPPALVSALTQTKPSTRTAVP